MIFYYSRAQKTKVAAEALHDITGLPLCALAAEINAAKGFLFAWKALKAAFSIKGCKVNDLPGNVPAEIYLCGPIWAGDMAGPLKYFIQNVDLSHTRVHMLLTAAQPTEGNRERVKRTLAAAHVTHGDIHLFATTKALPDKALLIEQLRELMGEEAA